MRRRSAAYPSWDRGTAVDSKGVTYVLTRYRAQASSGIPCQRCCNLLFVSFDPGTAAAHLSELAEAVRRAAEGACWPVAAHGCRVGW